jgi:hypothetical protein
MEHTIKDQDDEGLVDRLEAHSGLLEEPIEAEAEASDIQESLIMVTQRDGLSVLWDGSELRKISLRDGKVSL